MIIIKSQDGKLIEKIIRIKIAKNDRYELRGWGVDSLWNVMGAYPSEERAKEVMGMIEEHIRSLYSADMIKNISQFEMTTENYKELVEEIAKQFEPVAIFTMPKE